MTTIRYIWVQLRNNGGLFGGPDFSINCFVILIHFQFAHASMIIKVVSKVIDSLNIIYQNLILYSNYLFSKLIWYNYISC